MSINAPQNQFVIQLIQSTLAELGFDKLARDLGDSQNLILNYKYATALSHPITQQDVNAINLFYNAISNGEYVSIAGEISRETKGIVDEPGLGPGLLLMAIDEDPGSGNVLYSALLKPCPDPVLGLTLVQYLLKRTYFLELVLLYVIETKSTSDFAQRLIKYSGPSLDEPLDAKFLVNYIKENLLGLLELFHPSSSGTLVSKCKNLFPHELLGNLSASENEYIKLSSLILRSETSSLLEMIDIIFNQDFLLLTNVSYNNTVNIFDQLRTILKSKCLNQVFAFNKQYSQCSIPEGYMAKILDQAIKYQHYKNPFYLPPRKLTLNVPSSFLPPLLESPVNQDVLRIQFPDKLIHTLEVHTNEVWYTKFSPSGRYLATASADGRVIIYDVRNGFKQLASLESSSNLDQSRLVREGASTSQLSQVSSTPSHILYCCWDPSEEFIVTVGLNTLVRVWYVGLKKSSTDTPRRVTRSTSHITESVNPRLVSCFTLGQNVRVWTVEFLPPSIQTQVPVFIVGSPDKALRAFDVNGKIIFDFYADTDENSELAILEEGDSANIDATLLGVGADDGHLASEENTNSHVKVSSSRMGSVSSQDKSNSGLAALRKFSSSSDAVKFKDGEAGDDNGSMSLFNRVNDIAITPCGTFLITITANQQIDFFTLPQDMADASQTTRKLFSLNLSDRLTLCSISHSGKYLLVNLREIYVWDILNLPEKPILVRRLVGHSLDLNIVRSLFGYLADEGLGPEEQLVLSGSEHGYACIWKIKTGELISRVKAHCGLCNSVDWNLYGENLESDYGNLWCSVGDDKLVKIWGNDDSHNGSYTS